MEVCKISWTLGLELVPYGFHHILLAKASQKANLDSRAGNRRYLLMGGAAGSRSRGCRYRGEYHCSHFCKCSVPPTHWIVEVPNPRWFSKEFSYSKPDVLLQPEIAPKHPNKHHLDGPWCASWLVSPLPCHFLRILNISSIWPSLIGGLLICMKVYNLPGVITPLIYSLEKENLIVNWFNLQ